MTNRADAEATLIAKVRKLLAMAEGTSNADEADAFSRKAAELIAVHRLDPDRLSASAVDDPLGVLDISLGRGAYVRGRLALLQAVAGAHGCEVVFSTGPRGTTAHVVGFRSDRSTVELLYTSLHAQASGRMAAERRATGASTQHWRRSFLFGFAHEVCSMLASSRDQATREVSDAAGSLPALRDRERQVADHLAARFGRIAAARPAAPPTAGGFGAGRAAASSADVGRRAVPERRGIGRGADSS